MKKNINRIKVFDFFSGCGGTSQGLSQAGFDIVFGNDIDKDSSETFRLNFPKATFINDDIKNLSTNLLDKLIKKYTQHYILFSGCAPCQPFSQQNKNKNIHDPRAGLLNEFSKLVQKFEPDFIVVENVPGMQKIKESKGPFFNFLRILDQKKYLYSYGVIPAIWYGVPQKRERLVLIASKHIKIPLPPQENDGIKKPYSTVKDWIYKFPPINAGEKHPIIQDHIAARLTEINLRRIRITPEGMGRESWPDELVLNCHKKHSGHNDVYGRLSWHKPASALTTKCTSYSNGRFGHPTQDRAISVREAASLQTFPISYKFYGSFISKSKQIGNAVPPKMSEAIGNIIIKSIGKYDVKKHYKIKHNFP
ncbi:DNA cytosine methyltransferase [Arsenophonus nasoniae]|uniref:DNA (cytosine-5-)-methyltransferase n=1 Tax=Arsenophonus nasoniae TaxID=638 RepID=A0AA95GFZ6_9GAMM|nr:DNA cytosine methyltransferase [Arsenophonus nasoniae]WGL96279.1 DNA cytosine methyltransferase [Arsenophonus nasoniae]